MVKKYGAIKPGRRVGSREGSKEPGARTINGSQNPNGLSGFKRVGGYGESHQTRGPLPPVTKRPRLNPQPGRLPAPPMSGDESPMRKPKRPHGRGWWEHGPERRA